MFKPCIVVPCYNHSAGFGRIAESLAGCGVPVIVVNDGSSVVEAKSIAEICFRYSFRLLNLAKNCGKGGAMQQGFLYAYSLGYTHVLQIDADGQHDVADIAKFLVMAKEHSKAIINGVPVYDNSVPTARLYGRKITNFWVWVETCGKKVGDAMCGFRVYPLGLTMPVIRKLRFYRMGFDIEILVKSILCGVGTIDVQTKVIYPENGLSHFKMFRDNVKISWLHCCLCCFAVLTWFCKIWRFCCGKGN